MKKRILAVVMLQLVLVLNSCSSDSGDPTPTGEYPGELKADYIADVSFMEDFVIDANNNVFITGQTPNTNFLSQFRKIDLDGNVTSLKALDFLKFDSSRLSISKNGEILLVARNNTDDSDKIFHFENSFLDLNPFYTMKPISSPSANKIRLISISNTEDNSYFLYDYNNRQVKRYIPESNGDVFVAGSEKNEVKDGAGLNAGFGTVDKIISQNNVLYIIDNLNIGEINNFISSNIRKLEFVNNEWKVITLISTTDVNAYYSDIAFDSKNDLYVMVKGKGIYKLNLQNNVLTLFRDDEVKVAGANARLTLNFKDVEKIKIKGNDMYLGISTSLIKFSDFQSKLIAAGK